MHVSRSLPNEQPRVLILGAGFGALSVIKRLKKTDYQVTVVSPRNHFLFTPLLFGTAVGTHEDRNVTEPIRSASPDHRFYHARCVQIHPEEGSVTCESVVDPVRFRLEYDTLIIAVGGRTQTFGIPGVSEHALFLKEISDARQIRQRLVGLLERATLPGVSPEEKQRQLNWVVVGGGPTGSEFAGELHDFVQDVAGLYPGSAPEVRISLMEASDELLPMFDEALREYAEDRFRREGVDVRKGERVSEVCAEKIVLAGGEEIPAGMVVWATGIRPFDWLQQTGLATSEKGFLLTDAFCRVKGQEQIYAIGDAAVMEEQSLPATAQVAQQQGRYLGKALRREERNKPVKPFRFRNRGMLASLGDSRALADLPVGSVKGRWAWWFWRSVYLTKLVGWRNKWNVLRDWMVTALFGRETSRIP
jgi:NADH:ubiquinone reductase (non-electrogenic)